MPSVPPGSKILVSGANGFIAVWVVKALLEKGYNVRGTVRSAAKGEHLTKTFESYKDKFEIAIVEDITAEGAFDEAVKGVDAIEHTASPFHMRADHPDELIKPAVHGTVGIMKSALKNGDRVKRIVILSSCAAVVEPTAPPGTTFTENDFNKGSVAEVNEKGREASALAKYRASKTLAEQAAWEFYEKHRASVSWDVVSLNPPMVFGPALHEVTSADSLSTSTHDFLDFVVNTSPSEETLVKKGGCWVDVRDLAEAHVLAINEEKAGGERFIIFSGPYVWQDWVDVSNAVAADLNIRIQQGKPGGGKGAAHAVLYDATKSKSVLGMTYRGEEETAKDMLKDFKEKGLLKA